MRLLSRTTAVAAAAVIAGGLSLAGATSALAGGTPNPYPTPTETVTVTPVPVGGNCDMQPVVRAFPVQNYNPNPRHCPRIKQQEFDLQVGTFNPDGTVLGTGPIRFDTGTDQTLSPVLDRFSQGGNSVLIHHEALGGATVDFRTCTIALAQDDLPWWVNGGGTGVDRGALAVGVYDLRGLFSFPTRNFRCTLPVGLTAGQAAWDLNHNVGLPDPLMFDVAVQATGASELARVRVPEPCPTEKYAPTGAPSAAFGFPTDCPTPDYSPASG